MLKKSKTFGSVVYWLVFDIAYFDAQTNFVTDVRATYIPNKVEYIRDTQQLSCLWLRMPHRVSESIPTHLVSDGEGLKW